MSATTKGHLPEEPSANGANGGGRDDRGRFAVGNPGGPGNPHARQVARLRAAALNCTTEDQVREVLTKLHALAVGGDVRAAVAWLDRVGIRPDSIDLEERVAEMEGLLQEQVGDRR